MAKPVKLGGIEFPSKKAAKDFLQEVQENAKTNELFGEPITDPDVIDVLDAILDLHERGDEKRGIGVDFYFVDLAKNYQSQKHIRHGEVLLCIRRTDGTSIDFSWTKVINAYDNQGSQHKLSIEDAMRGAIRADVEKIREEAFQEGKIVPCHDTGIELKAFGEAEVRYRNPTWGCLKTQFVQECGGWEKIKIRNSGGQAILGSQFADSRTEEEWKAFWKSNAKPVLVAKRDLEKA